ncbi:OsmC family protein [Haloferula sargassicola]|uniref:OsmC-like protein n=1 Tax=Haloferula sargassicola TaxID=490096 RepID=A0ABP9UTU4_9BACT
MVSIQLEYQGGLHCAAVHGPSKSTLETDAPVDNNGRGESFSPTDLVATALGSCMLTIMGIVAQRKELPMEGAKVEVRKHMSADTPRRISRLEVDMEIPLAADHPERAMLEAAAKGCPVFHSIHPDIEVALDWKWVG